MERKFHFLWTVIIWEFLTIACVQCRLLSHNEDSSFMKMARQTEDSILVRKPSSTIDLNVPRNNQILNQMNCTARSIHDFPESLFSRSQRRQGAVIFYVFLGFYCFLMTAYVCNDYLLPALDCICASLNISADVAGATFLATASCFPEFFVNVVGTFLTESDLGVGTVVGSAVFNTFVTPACGALSAAKAIHLKWDILTRDCIIYILSVSCLVIVMWDGIVTWYEAVILLLLFVGYFNILLFSRRILQFISRFSSGRQLENDKNGKKQDTMPYGTYKPFCHSELILEYRNSLSRAANLKATINEEVTSDLKKPLDECVEPETLFKKPEGGTLTQLWFLFTWPLRILLFLTIPDTRYHRLRNWYPVTFLLCVIWIAVCSYLVSWMTTVVGDTLEIPDSVMGITFLAAGGNMPEMVSVVILSRKNHGDMAMSNTLGSNTLDILLCLGFPWTIKILLTGRNVHIVSGTFIYTVSAILICVIGFYAVTALYGFELNRKVGIACFCMCSMYLVIAVLLELNFFFFANLPMCNK